ncbi:MAG: hypothetical protein Q8L20_12590 [Gammaproteobacteria bacterium]|nr:hypothetical protein [Gammaproteobacteria bacterium]
MRNPNTNNRFFTPQMIAALALCGMAAWQPVLAQDANTFPGYRSVPFSLPPDIERMLIVDADRDGLSDLLTVGEKQISLYFQRQTGFDFNQPDTFIELPGRSAGWELSENYQDAQGNRAFSLLALIDGTRVMQWQLTGRSFAEPTALLTDLFGFPGSGVNRLNFSRDINNDGLDDLIIPGAGSLLLHIRNADGSYQQPLSVLSDMQVNTTLSLRQSLERDVGQSLRIPLIELRDVNNDGNPDLISETTESFDVFLANAGGNEYFSQNPTYAIDRLEIRERLGSFDIDQLDFSNLTGMLALTHEETLEDVDNDGIADFVLREGGKVSLFAGTPDGMDFSQPRQVLRSGGNVLTTFLQDENEDGLKDLWLWRVEPVSVGDLFLWLALSGSINVEAFVYHNEGRSFARRPARQLTVTLRFPSAVSLISTAMSVRGQVDAARDAQIIPTAVAKLSGIGSNQDLVVLLNEQIQVFLNSMAPEPAKPEDQFLASLNYSRSRNNYEIDIRRIIDEFQIEQNEELRSVAGRTPDHTLALPQAMRNGDLMSTNLNNDGLDDIFVFLEHSKEAINGVLLLSGD